MAYARPTFLVKPSLIDVGVFSVNDLPDRVCGTFQVRNTSIRLVLHFHLTIEAKDEAYCESTSFALSPGKSQSVRFFLTASMPSQSGRNDLKIAKVTVKVKETPVEREVLLFYVVKQPSTRRRVLAAWKNRSLVVARQSKLLRQAMSSKRSTVGDGKGTIRIWYRNDSKTQEGLQPFLLGRKHLGYRRFISTAVTTSSVLPPSASTVGFPTAVSLDKPFFLQPGDYVWFELDAATQHPNTSSEQRKQKSTLDASLDCDGIFVLLCVDSCEAHSVVERVKLAVDLYSW